MLVSDDRMTNDMFSTYLLTVEKQGSSSAPLRHNDNILGHVIGYSMYVLLSAMQMYIQYVNMSSILSLIKTYLASMIALLIANSASM